MGSIPALSWHHRAEVVRQFARFLLVPDVFKLWPFKPLLVSIAFITLAERKALGLIPVWGSLSPVQAFGSVIPAG